MATAKRADAKTTEQARKLVLFGATDEQVAWFFGIDILTLAVWAQESREFFTAITPTDDEWSAYRASIEARKGKRNAANARRRAENPSGRMIDAVRARLWAALKLKRPEGKLFSRLGYTKEELVAHLQARFAPEMSWANYGQWHVDHIKPCAAFDQSDSRQFADCWKLSNLQPLWEADNLKKGARYVGP